MTEKCEDPIGLAYAVIFEMPGIQLKTTRPEEQRVPMWLALEQALATLTARQDEILQLRFGLRADGLVHSLEEAEAQMGISQGHGRPYEAGALKRLRSQPARGLIEPYLPK